MLKIWGRPNSINVQKVAWCAAELGLSFERIDAGREFGIVSEPWFLAMNPNSRVPVIDDEGFVLWESNAIVRYLADRYGHGGLSPEEPRLRALADQWMDWQALSLMAALGPAFWGLIRTPEAERDARAIAEAERECLRLMAILDHQLSKRSFMLGDRLTMADIPVGAASYRWYALPLDHGNFPHLRRWYEDLERRPGFRAQVMIPLS